LLLTPQVHKIVRILDSHTSALQWVDATRLQMAAQVEAVKRQLAHESSRFERM
jgi:hypothetical protein